MKFLLDYCAEVKALTDNLLHKQNYKICAIIDLLFEAWQKNVSVFIMGNGGSASTATHFAADLGKTIILQPGGLGLRAFSLDNIPYASAIVNDLPKQDLFTTWLETYYEEDGIGVAFSVHGGSGQDQGDLWSQNLLCGMRWIKDRGGKTIGFSGFDGGPLAELVDVPIVIPVRSTPLVESFHVLVHHLIVFRLKEMIEEQEKKRLSSAGGSKINELS